MWISKFLDVLGQVVGPGFDPAQEQFFSFFLFLNYQIQIYPENL